jgi:4a-hydroxytetrahydrobiopterin dehydratase
MLRLKSKQIRAELASAKGWKLQGQRISKIYAFEDFVRAIKFINRVARFAQSMNHHPDIDIRYNRVILTLTTHDEGGLTMRDFRLARKIDGTKSS